MVNIIAHFKTSLNANADVLNTLEVSTRFQRAKISHLVDSTVSAEVEAGVLGQYYTIKPASNSANSVTICSIYQSINYVFIKFCIL